MAGETVRIPSVITTALLVVSVLFPALSLLSIYLRWFARRKVLNGWRWDDWFVAVTWVVTLAISIDVWASARYIGVDYLEPPIPMRNRYSAKCVWSLTLILQASLAMVKICVLLFYKRVFSTPRFIIVAWVGIAIVSVWGAVTIVLHAIVAKPISSSWTGFGTYRMNPVALSEARAGSSLILDLMILLLPIHKIFNLHISFQRKISVALIFAMGGFCCIAAAVRLALVIQTVASGANSKAGGFTAISRTSQTVIWCIIEPNCSIIAASLPCYGPLFRGRAPESIIRSVRSVLSLASRRSNDSKGSQKKSGSKPYGADGNGLAIPMNNAKEITESEIELTDVSHLGSSTNEPVRGWEEYGGGQSVAHVDATPNHDIRDPTGQNIKVTKSYATMS